MLDKELWIFDKALLVLLDMDEYGTRSEDYFLYTNFKVQIHNIPICSMTRDIVGFIDGQVGNYLEVDSDKNSHCWDQFAWVRIKLDVTNALKRQVKVWPSKNFDCFCLIFVIFVE